MTRGSRRIGMLVLAILAGLPASRVGAQPPATPIQSPAGQAGLLVTIDRLGAFDFDARTEAARAVRRAPAAAVVPLLDQAARSHRDEYVRYRALVLLSGFGDAAASETMQALMGDHNDRIRTVAYEWIEHHPRPDLLVSLLAALPRERSEFVRPALTRALAAFADDPRARDALLPLITKGEDLFRGAVIDAIGDYKRHDALGELLDVARLDGPLQDDAITAAGKIGDPAAIGVVAALRTSAPPELQPTISMALCLLGSDCQAQTKYLRDTLSFAAAHAADDEPLLRGVAHAMGVLVLAGHREALDAMIDAAIPASDAARGPLALGLGLVALRNPTLVLDAVQGRADLERAIDVLRDAFDMLTEDFEEEQFYVAIRRVYWAEADGTARKHAAELLMERLEF